MDIERISRNFLLQGIQHWGQTAAQREKATRDYVVAAGIKFGTKEADDWLNGVVGNLQRGEFNSEARQLQAAIEARKAKAA